MLDRPIKGIFIMLLAVFLISIMNIFAKLAGDAHTPIEVVFYRNFVGLALVCALIGLQKKSALFKTQRLKGHILRSIIGTIGLALVFWAYQLMPMAETTAIMFAGGLSTIFFARVLLGETIGVFRFGAVIVGLLGAIIVIAPDESNITALGATVAFTASAIGGGLVAVMLRSLAKTEHALTTAFYFLAIGCFITGPYALYFGEIPTIKTYIPLLLCGITGGISLVIKSQAYRYAEASLLSPIHYTGIIWATFFGWLIWSDWPTINVFIGAGVIIASNFIIIWHEKRTKKSTLSTLE